MDKYKPLEEYLSAQSASQVPMTFEDIERVIHDTLPPSARIHRAWWSNNESSSVITRSWKRAGFRSSEVDMDGQKLVFRRVAEPSRAANKVTAVAESTPAYAVRGRHPLRGALKGMIGVLRGTDLTAPADPDWGKKSE